MNLASGHHIVGRFAPSPTGALHAGSLAAAVGSYLMARQCGGRWLLRLDDLDRQRQVPGMADDIMRTLESFGLLWDGEVARQSRNIEEYQQAFTRLQQSGMIYPCCCSRKEIAGSASAPHAGDNCIPYPGTCRSGMSSADSPVRSWRVRVPDEVICFDDLRAGKVCQRLPEVSGDFAIKRGDGEFAYQLAVVVDDYLSGVNQVVRGDDLLESTPRQIYLHRLLALPQPDYCHLPLITGPNGSKLSKRDNLVSCQPGNLTGRQPGILVETLNFLGQQIPPDLSRNSCREILAWSVTHFDRSRLATAMARPSTLIQ